MPTKRTDQLVPGDVLLLPPVDPGTSYLDRAAAPVPMPVLSVAPWILTAGPKAGTQSTEGRGRGGAPLFAITLDHTAGEWEGNPAVPADRVWDVQS